jgi:hypothetical protein
LCVRKKNKKYSVLISGVTVKVNRIGKLGWKKEKKYKYNKNYM